MATVLPRECSVSDKLQNEAILRALYAQKQASTFCDVIMKVCGKEIYAHSTVLAAASPYFKGFLSLDLPRQFSQRAPQVIEIQIDGSEPNMFYEEAVAAVIDFIYTGSLKIRDDNVGQIMEIAKIMQMENIVKSCNDFIGGMLQSGDILSGSKILQDKAVNTFISDAPISMFAHKDKHSLGYKMRTKKLKSIAVQVHPKLITGKSDEVETRDFGTSTERWPTSRVDFSLSEPRKRGRPPKLKSKPVVLETVNDFLFLSTHENNESSQSNEVEVQKEATTEQETALNPESGVIEDTSQEEESADIQESTQAEIDEIQQLVETENHDDSTTANIPTDEDPSPKNKVLPKESVTPVKDMGNVEEVFIALGKSTRSGRVRKLPSKLRDSDIYSTSVKLVKKIKEEPIEKGETPVKQPVPSVKETTLAEATSDLESLPKDLKIVQKIETEMEETPTDPVVHIVEKEILENIRQEEIGMQDADESAIPISVNDVEQMDIQEDDEDEDEYEEYVEEVLRDKNKGTKVGLQQKRKRQYHRKSLVEETDMFDDVKPTIRGKYSCDLCDFITNKVREMSNHHKLHKFEQNTCYYCDLRFEDRDELSVHIEKHKGPRPFFCPTCQHRFKSRTMLNMHLPKHSDDKPFICEICSASFKWKHALKGHMVTHTDKKEHLCDICGYSTAHKSQLKAHHLIHTGELYKCEYPYCNYQSTKKQNLKYHYLTHTREKPHQCEVCGQAFSLVKNMRRHMLLHSKEKKFKCLECDFASTRYDKLKEHRLKQHGFGTPPEKRIKTTDMLFQSVIAPTQIKTEMTREDDVDPNISEASEMIIDAEGRKEASNAAVVLQAIDEEHVAEIEQHVQQVSNAPTPTHNMFEGQNLLFQVQFADGVQTAKTAGKKQEGKQNVVEVTKINKPETYLQLTDTGGKGQPLKILKVTQEQLEKINQLPISVSENQIVSAVSTSNVVFAQPSTVVGQSSASSALQAVISESSLSEMHAIDIASQESANQKEDQSNTSSDTRVITITQDQSLGIATKASLVTEASDKSMDSGDLSSHPELNYITSDGSIGYAMADGTYITTDDGNTYITTPGSSGEEATYQEYITPDGQVVRLDAAGTVLVTEGEATADTVIVGEEYAEIMSSEQVSTMVTEGSEFV